MEKSFWTMFSRVIDYDGQQVAVEKAQRGFLKFIVHVRRTSFLYISGREKKFEIKPSFGCKKIGF